MYLGTGQWVCLLLWDSKLGQPCCCVKLHSVAAFILEKNKNSHSYDLTQIIHSLHEPNCRTVPMLLSRVVRYLYPPCRCGTPEKWNYQRKMAIQFLQICPDSAVWTGSSILCTKNCPCSLFSWHKYINKYSGLTVWLRSILTQQQTQPAV